MRRLGQHFLICSWVADTMLKAADLSEDDTVLEIGPGHGELTYALASRARRVIAVEKDEMLAETLREASDRKNMGRVVVITGDILALLRTPPWRLHLQGVTAMGNIPYYLTSRLLRLLLEAKPRPQKIVFTVQKEVAERIAAKPPRMNLLALSVRAFGTPKIICAIPSSCFTPRPSVDSAMIAISNISNDFFEKNSLNQDEFFRVIKKAFSAKRKTLTNALVPLFEKKNVQQALMHVKLPHSIRAQELSEKQWIQLVSMLRANVQA